MADGVTCTIKGLDRRLHALQALGPAGIAAVKAANEVNAREFASAVAQVVPVGDDEKREGARLASTIQVLPGKWSTSMQVSIGGPEAPYALHLEAGHMTKSGKHVPGRPYWWTTMRLHYRQYRARTARAVNLAVKRAFASGGA